MAETSTLESSLLTDARLGAPPSALLQTHYTAPGLAKERRKSTEIVEVDVAHVAMLAECDIIERAEARAILEALETLRFGALETIETDAARGSMLLQIENHLSKTIGKDAAGMLSTARSRIDQGATFRRLFERNLLFKVIGAVVALETVLIERAEQHVGTIMPGHTHLQPAQPWVFGHYLLGFSDRLHEDTQRLVAAYGLTNLNPLGTVGGNGTSWPIDRDRTTELLGFAAPIDNARLGRDIRYDADIAAACAMVMSDLNDIATDLQLWSTYEFALVELDSAFCGTSSIFPQKKNPVALEGVRTAAAGAVQWFGHVLSICRGVGSGDFAMRSAGFIEDVLNTTLSMTELLTGVVQTLIVNEDRMRASASIGWTTASNLADCLVRDTGLSYREAHHAVAAFIKACIDNRRHIDDVTAADFRVVLPVTSRSNHVITDDWLRAALAPENFIRSLRSRGGASADEISRLLARAMTDRNHDCDWLVDEDGRLRLARQKLDGAILAIRQRP